MLGRPEEEASALSADSRPASLVAERAVRYLTHEGRRLPSTTLVHAVLATRMSSEAAAKRVLETAFSGDPRLRYLEGGWSVLSALPTEVPGAPLSEGELVEPDHVLLILVGQRPARSARFRLHAVAGVRIRAGAVLSACGGAVGTGASATRLASSLREMLRDATPVVHDPPGSLPALERWLGQTLDAPLSLRRLAVVRLGLPAGHGLQDLAAALGIRWRDTDDPLDLAEALEWGLEGLRRPGETLQALRDEAAGRGGPPVDWSRMAFGPDFLDDVPRSPGTYRFYDAEDRLLYVGKSKDLRRRLRSYFREGARPARVQRLLDRLHRVELEPSGSDLEAVLREAAQIARRSPEYNVQRRVRSAAGRKDRLRSVLVLEPAEPPWVLRAYLLRDGRLIDRVPLGPRGGGLQRVGHLLDAHFFETGRGLRALRGDPVDVEVVGRWLAAHREQVVAFDPTHLRSSAEVVGRLRWFLGGGPLKDPTGRPVVPR
jgi:hypothetical protein